MEDGPPESAPPPPLRAGVSPRPEGLLGGLGVYLLGPAPAVSLDPVAAARAAPPARRRARHARLAGGRQRGHGGAQPGPAPAGPGGAQAVADQTGLAAPAADSGRGRPMESARSAWLPGN